MATVYDVTASQIVATLSGTDNTAILQNPGTVALFNNDVGKSVFVDNFLYTTTDEENTVVPISNTSIAISPYTWYSGSDYKQINAAGGYIKVAFSGTHLGVGVDTSKLAGISPSNIFLRTYIDGSTTPVNKTLANVNNGEVVFSDNLASGNHYAIIYGGFNVSNSRRSGNPPASLMIKSIILSTGSEVQSLTGTPIVPSNKKILFYGDSITEGSLVSVAEKGYAPTLAKNLGLEYGQLGYGGGRWNTIHSSGVPAFYTNTITDNRRNYSENKCRLDGNGKYLDGAPTAIFNNYGINDARGSTGAPTMRSAVTGWLGAARAASSPNTEMYMIMPFNYGNGSYDATYKAAYLSGFQDYTLAHPDDDRVYLIDLGVKAWDVVDTNSIDDLHPNDTGSALLAGLIKDALTPLVVQNLSGIVDSDTEISLIWEYPAPDTNNIRHINTDYNVAYQASGTSTWTTFATLPGVTTGIQITGLTAGTNYTFRITSLNTLVVPDVAPIATISALTTGTPPVTPPTNPTTPTIPTSSG
jgi:lysophospholipase L1-like esterase